MNVDSIYLNNDKFQKNYIGKTITTKPSPRCTYGDIMRNGQSVSFTYAITNYGQVSVSGTVTSQVVMNNVLYVGLHISGSGFLWIDARDLE